jgi:tRNA dimethylallyltransferase
MDGTRSSNAVSPNVGPPLYAVVGPTATGKTALALALAEALSGEIVTVDSAQVFRGLDVGTAKPTREEQSRVRHHLIDVIEPTEQWSAAEFADAADAVIAEVRTRGRAAILCGGTGLWLRALVHGIFEAPEIDPEVRSQVRREIAENGAEVMHRVLAKVDPEAASRIKPQDPQRIGRALEVYRQVGVPISRLQAGHAFKEVRYRLLAVGISWPKDELFARIKERTLFMYGTGLLDEVDRCLKRGISPTSPGLSIIGYRDAVRHLEGKCTLDEAVEATTVATRQYAKRQRNWFQKVGEVEWVDHRASIGSVLARLDARAAAL